MGQHRDLDIAGGEVEMLDGRAGAVLPVAEIPGDFLPRRGAVRLEAGQEKIGAAEYSTSWRSGWIGSGIRNALRRLGPLRGGP